MNASITAIDLAGFDLPRCEVEKRQVGRAKLCQPNTRNITKEWGLKFHRKSLGQGDAVASFSGPSKDDVPKATVPVSELRPPAFEKGVWTSSATGWNGETVLKQHEISTNGQEQLNGG